MSDEIDRCMHGYEKGKGKVMIACVYGPGCIMKQFCSDGSL